MTREELVEQAREAWLAGGWELPYAEDALWSLFEAGGDHSQVAIGLLAASMPGFPHQTLEIGRKWLEITTDPSASDSLGWLIMGPCGLATGSLVAFAVDARTHPHPELRRGALMSAMVALPIPIEGPILSPLQARAGESHIQFVDVAASSIVGGIAEQFLNDRDALVQEALVRVVTEWVKHDAKGAADWLAELRDPPANVRALIG